MTRRPTRSTRTYPLFPYPTLFRSLDRAQPGPRAGQLRPAGHHRPARCRGSSPMIGVDVGGTFTDVVRSEEHTSELQSLMRISYAVFCLKKKKLTYSIHIIRQPRTHYQI